MTVRELTDTFYLAFTVWREARGESLAARIGVAYSILNRVDRPKWWGSTISEVVTKRWQYSSLTDPKDPQLARAWPLPTDRTWQECIDIATQTQVAALKNPVPGADSYHDTSIAPPYWTKDARRVGQIGRIVFYDVDHDYQVPGGHDA